MPTTPPPEEIVSNLVHDLRQPLANLEIGLLHLSLVLHPAPERIREQLQLLQRQVSQASQLLNRAAEEAQTLQSDSAAVS